MKNLNKKLTPFPKELEIHPKSFDYFISFVILEKNNMLKFGHSVIVRTKTIEGPADIQEIMQFLVKDYKQNLIVQSDKLLAENISHIQNHGGNAKELPHSIETIKSSVIQSLDALQNAQNIELAILSIHKLPL